MRSQSPSSLAGAVCLLALLGTAPPGRAAPPAVTENVDDGSQAQSDVVFLPEPATPLYAPYIADPRRPAFSFQTLRFAASEIPDSGDTRYGVKFGGVLPVLEARSGRAGDRGWELGLEGGFLVQFDRTRGDDAIGWDGTYGLIASWRRSDVFAYRFGLHHVSAHVGDEYAERTGRQRIDYTRGELIAGVRASPAERWRAYVEAGWAYDLRNETVQRRWRAQLGLEYVAPWGSRSDWYAAVDLYATEERDWRIDRALQAGIALHRGERIWRFGIEHYRGRSLLGEFFQHDERYTGLAVWLDL